MCWPFVCYCTYSNLDKGVWTLSTLKDEFLDLEMAVFGFTLTYIYIIVYVYIYINNYKHIGRVFALVPACSKKNLQSEFQSLRNL